MRSFVEVAASVKFALSTAVATMASGFAYFIGLIPNDIGKLASLLGAMLTVVMIGYWLEQKKKARLESEILEEQLKKMRAGDGKP